MPDNINMVVVDDVGGLLVCNAIQIGDSGKEDEAVEEDVNVNDSRPPAARSPQSRDCRETKEEVRKRPMMGPHQETSEWSGPQIMCL
jgi:hypothetical protein